MSDETTSAASTLPSYPIYEDMKYQALLKALQESGGNRTHAKDALGVSLRTIRNWIRKFGLETRFPAKYGKASHYTPKPVASHES